MRVGVVVGVGMLVGVGVLVGKDVGVLVGVAVLAGTGVAVGAGVTLGMGVGADAGAQADSIRLTSKSTSNARFIVHIPLSAVNAAQWPSLGSNDLCVKNNRTPGQQLLL